MRVKRVLYIEWRLIKKERLRGCNKLQQSLPDQAHFQDRNDSELIRRYFALITHKHVGLSAVDFEVLVTIT